MNFTSEQEAIFAFFREGTGNLVVEALAGTGKTTTAKEAFNHASENRMLYAVFNKKNQVEAASKITDSRVDVSTLHSLGFKFIKRVWGKAKPDDDVEFDRAEVALDGGNQNPELVGLVRRLVGFVKNTVINPTQRDVYDAMVANDIGGFDPREDEIIVCAVIKVLAVSKVKDRLNRISFDDMVWLPCAMELVRPWYDLVVIDEAQDMNMPQLVMARKASRGRVVVIGDSRQAIYGFRGAVQNAMAMMKVTLRAKSLPLSVTYRCPSLVVALAQEFVPSYRAAASNPAGSVLGITKEKALEGAVPGDAVLSRLNAPLMPLALQFLRKRVPARIEGRDLARQFISMVQSFKAKSVPNYIEKVEAWAEKQIARVLKQKNAAKKVEGIHDTKDTLIAIAEGAKNVDEIRQRIDELFQDTTEKSKPAVVLSSVHKAKGLEWDRVFVLVDTFRKGKGQEEDNIYYVAITRTKRELFLVGAQSDILSERLLSGSASNNDVGAAGHPTGLASPVGSAVITPAIKSLPEPLEPDPLSRVSGMVFHRRGNVIRFNGVEWFCERVSDCNAKFICLAKVKKTIKFTNDEGEAEEKTITGQQQAKQWLSTQTDPADVLHRMTEAEIQDFLSGKKARPAEETEETKQGETSNDNMKKIKATKTDRPSFAGRSQYIHKLKVEGKKKDEARELTKKKYPGTGDSKVFDAVWDGASKTAKVPVKKATSKVSTKKASPPARKPSKASAPKPPAATPPPRASAPPPAAPQPEQEQAVPKAVGT